MERWLNQEIQAFVLSRRDITLLNPYKGKKRLVSGELEKRRAFHTLAAESEIKALVAAVEEACG
jgi:hypothetical protein